MPGLDHIFEAYIVGASVPLIFFALFFATFVSEDAACLIGASLAASGAIGFWWALAACFLGIVTGDILLYWVGRWAGPGVLRTRIVQGFVSEAATRRATEWLGSRGAAVIFLSRFVTGLRLPTYLVAGALRLSFPRFAIYFLLAAMVWTPLLIGSAAYAQSTLFQGNIFAGALIIFLLSGVSLKMLRYRDRRMFVGKIKRISNWDFWPLQVFYLPVVAYIFLLAIRYRSLTVFTCANPGIHAGGFRGESKDQIYKQLWRGAAGRGKVLSHIKISGADSVEANVSHAIRFIEETAIGFPVAVKPDVGERGSGVEFAHSEDDLRRLIASANGDLIVQEFASGVEASIFYYRYPNDACGRIFSITEKRFPVVHGDGRSTIEELILNDDRAVALARKYFEHNALRLKDVPGQSEAVQLIDIGTHSRGAIFLDGERMHTDALERAVDDICREFHGFYFGRFDVRGQSFNQIAAGDFKIIELNGVTSESTNIYDPKYSLIDAYRILFRQWRIAFEIGILNRKLGAVPATLNELAGLAFRRRTERTCAEI